LMFGVTGKAWDSMDDRTIALPRAELVKAGQPETKAWFTVHGFRFLYEDMNVTSDDNKTSITAKVSLWAGNDKVEDLEPAVWKFHNAEQTQVTVVAIKSRL